MNLHRIISLLMLCLIFHSCRSSQSFLKAKTKYFAYKSSSCGYYSITRLFSHSDSVCHCSIQKYQIIQHSEDDSLTNPWNPIQYMAKKSSFLTKIVQSYAVNFKQKLLLSTTSNGLTRSSRRKSFVSILSSSLISRMCLFLVLCSFSSPRVALASVIMPSEPSNNAAPASSPLQSLLAWFLLFTLSAVMHSAESAITKISPWKVQQFVEEEGSSSPFSTLSKDITRLLITILLTTTACSIYSTALFVATISQLFPNCSLGFITAALVNWTFVTVNRFYKHKLLILLFTTAFLFSFCHTDCRDVVLRRTSTESVGRVQLRAGGPEAGSRDQPAVHAAAARHHSYHLSQRPCAQERRHAQRGG